MFLSENEPIPRWNRPILNIAKIMKYFLSSVAEAEMGDLFLTAKEMVPVIHTFTLMGWHQPPSPIQGDKSTTVGMTNSTPVPRKSKYWYLRLNGL